MHVEHFMTTNPVACDVGDSVETVARLMRDKGVGSVVVLQGGKVAGLVTDRQVAVRCVADGLGAGATVKDIMTENPATLSLDDNIFSAVDTLRSAGVVRRVPVVNTNRELLGVVSISDIAVIAKDLVDAVFLDATHNAMSEAHVLTGGKRVVHQLRRPTQAERMPPEPEIHPVTHRTAEGGDPSGGARAAGIIPPSARKAEERAERTREQAEKREEKPKGLLEGLFK